MKMNNYRSSYILKERERMKRVVVVDKQNFKNRMIEDRYRNKKIDNTNKVNFGVKLRH